MSGRVRRGGVTECAGNDIVRRMSADDTLETTFTRMVDATADDPFPDLLRPERANLGKRIHSRSIPILSSKRKNASWR